MLAFRDAVQSHPQLEQQLGPLWPRALFFSLLVVICLMAFGLYSTRQRALSVVLARVVPALFYLAPRLRLWRGVEAIAVIAAGCGVVLSRLVFARVVNQKIFNSQYFSRPSHLCAKELSRQVGMPARRQ